MEIWKDIPGYEGIYQASSQGRIRTAEGKTTHSVLHGERHWRQRILKPKACRDYTKCGYRVTLWRDKIPRDFLVARLVATAFLDNLIETTMTVNHKDGNRLNNNIENLEWVTLIGNIRHGFEHGLYPQNKTTLINVETNEAHSFRSQAEADRFLNRRHGYVNSCVKNNRMAMNIKGQYFYVSSTPAERE